MCNKNCQVISHKWIIVLLLVCQDKSAYLSVSIYDFQNFITFWKLWKWKLIITHNCLERLNFWVSYTNIQFATLQRYNSTCGQARALNFKQRISNHQAQISVYYLNHTQSYASLKLQNWMCRRPFFTNLVTYIVMCIHT